MIGLMEEPVRVMSVIVDQRLIRGVIVGRVRALVLPMGKAEHLQVNDCLWVKESMAVPVKQPAAGALRFSYGGDGQTVEVRWPAAIARPAPGFRPAEAMPVQASRLTLQVIAQRVTRLLDVQDDEAALAGVTSDEDGYRNALLADRGGRAFATASEALVATWVYQHGAEGDSNPEVVVVLFRAVHRNIGRLVVGLGSGGAR